MRVLAIGPPVALSKVKRVLKSVWVSTGCRRTEVKSGRFLTVVMFAVMVFAAGGWAQDRQAPPSDQVPPDAQAQQPQAGDQQAQPADDGQVTVQARAQGQVDPQQESAEDQDQQNTEPPADPNQ